MYAEGYARNVSPEWVMTTSQGFLWLLLALWLVIGLGALWRRTIWQRNGAAITTFATASAATVRATWWGFRVSAPAGAVEWRYAPLDGAVTRVVRGKKVRDEAGWVDAARATALLAGD